MIASLWAVDDEATRAWMDALYHARLDQGATTAEAVRAAQRAVLDRSRAQAGHAHPHAWGAFVSAGRP